MEDDCRREQSAPSGADFEAQAQADLAAFDGSFSYYLHSDCPDKHIREALRGLISRRLSENETCCDRHSTIPDGEALHLRWLIAVNPNTPASVLASLLNTDCPALLERIAENPRASSVSLARLAFDPCADVRAAVADNPNTPIETVWMLSRDENADVRYRLAESYHLPQPVLQALAEDDNPFVAARAHTTLKRIEQSEGSCDVRHLRVLAVSKRVFHMYLSE